MPVVPKYNAPNIQEQNIPAARVTTDAPIEAFGGGTVASAPTKAVETFVDIVEKERQKADQLAVAEADFRASNLKTKLFFDPKDGAMNRKGKSAFEAIGEYEESYTAQLQRIEEGLTGEQKNQFRARAQGHMSDLSSQLQRHAFSEGEQYENEVTTSSLKAYREEARAGYQNPGKVNQSIFAQMSVLADHAKRTDKPAEWLKVETAKVASGTQRDVIERMLANEQDEDAQKYYDKVKDQVTGEDAVHVEKSLHEGTLRGASQKKSDEILNQNMSMSQSLEAARQIEDPKLRDETSRRVREEFSLRKAAKDDQQNKLFDQAANIVEANGGNRDKVPPSIWAAMDISQRNAVDARAAQLRAGTKPVTDFTKYYDLKTLASSAETRDEFLKTNLGQFRASLADPEFKEMINLQTQLRKGDDASIKEFQTNEQMLDQNLPKIGLAPRPKGKEKIERVLEIKIAFGEQIKAFKERNGKAPTNKETQEIIDNMFVQGEILSGSWYKNDPNKRGYQIQPGETLTVPVDSIPKAEVTKIKDTLKRQNLRVTEENIQKLYSTMISKMRR